MSNVRMKELLWGEKMFLKFMMLVIAICKDSDAVTFHKSAHSIIATAVWDLTWNLVFSNISSFTNILLFIENLLLCIAKN